MEQRMSDLWNAMVEGACHDALREATDGQWHVSGERADLLGRRAMQLVANKTGLAVVPTGPSDHHNGVTFDPVKV